MEKSFLQKYGIVLVLLVMCVALSILSPVFLTTPNLINVIRQISINGILATGMTFIILTGGIDLSVGSQVAFTGAIVAGLLSGGMNMVLAIVLGLLLGSLLGLVNGFIIAKGGIPPFIVTLGMLTAARGFTLIYTGGRPIYNLGASFRFLGAGYIAGIPVPVIILGIILIVAHLIAKHTIFGREVYAVGGNPEAAVYSGINKDKRLIQVYTLMGLLSAITGIVLTSRLGSADPTAGNGFELDAIAAVVIGGTSMFGGEGAVTGTLVGALIIGVINNGLNLLGVSSYYQQVVKGVIVVGAVLMDGYARKKNKKQAKGVSDESTVNA